MATGGYCWKPEYDEKNNILKPVANPDQAEFRKELKEQAKWAGNIVVASDPDPSGDFIAWSISRFLKSSLLKRGQIRHVSKSGIVQSLSETSELNESMLESRLKNRYLIRNIWMQIPELPDFGLAGVASAFSSDLPYRSFLDENGVEYKSSQPVALSKDEWIQVHPDPSLNEFRNQKPLSTFDVIDKTVRNKTTNTYSEAESLLFDLFQHKLPLSNDSLISYPRTDANALYSETWESLFLQFNQLGINRAFKPSFLRETADANEPHESIHPLKLLHRPEQISGELARKPGELYKLIYEETLKAVSMPAALDQPLINKLLGDIHFYPANGEVKRIPESLRPVCSVSDFGHRLKQLSLITPSSFGSKLDQWISGGILKSEGSYLTPGKMVLPYLNRSETYYRKFIRLKEQLHQDLQPETVYHILTS